MTKEKEFVSMKTLSSADRRTISVAKVEASNETSLLTKIIEDLLGESIAPADTDLESETVCLTCGNVMCSPYSTCSRCGADLDRQYSPRYGEQGEGYRL